MEQNIFMAHGGVINDFAFIAIALGEQSAMQGCNVDGTKVTPVIGGLGQVRGLEGNIAR